MAPRSTHDIKYSDIDLAHLGELVVQHLGIQGYCTIDAGIEQDNLKKALEDVEALEAEGKFCQTPEMIVDGLLGSEGSAQVAELDEKSLDAGPSIGSLDAVMEDVGNYIKDAVPNLGFGIHGRSQGLLHCTGTPGPEPLPLNEDDCSKWMALLMAGKILCMLCLGPSTGMLEIRPFADKEATPFVLATSPGTIILTRADTLLHSHFGSGEKLYLLSCFFLHDKVLSDKRSSCTNMTPCAQRLNEWALNHLKELKDQQDDDKPMNIPREWELMMNHNFHRGQQMAVRGIGIRSPCFWNCNGWYGAQTAGTDFVGEVPITRWDYEKTYNPDPQGWRHFQTFSKHVACMDGAELFDNKMFGITPAESKVMDPQQRHVLENGYEALWSAGYKKSKITNSVGGMYLGFGTGSSDFGHVDRSGDASSEGSFGATGGSAAITANRFSFCLGMKGPSLSCDNDAASSLVAVYLGAEALQAKGRFRANEFSLSGGIKMNFAMFYWVQKQAMGLLSPTGRCMTFDTGADGLAHGDASAFVCIKALIDVVDGNAVLREDGPLYAIIAGSNMTSMGNNLSMGAPHGPSQQECITNAVRAAGISGFDVDAVEVYGTGSLIADAVETDSVLRALRSVDGDDAINVLSCKTHMANTCESAGILSLIKVINSIQWGTLAPNLHLAEINPHLDYSNQPLGIPTEILEYRMRTAYVGCGARGIGGTTVHCTMWGRIDDAKLQSPEPSAEKLGIAFWPGGGGQTESSWMPRKGFHIAGTWNKWKAEPMERIDEGIYMYMLTLGENRWEHFQIWLDGDPKRCFYPAEPRAAKGVEVEGPGQNHEAHKWEIDGRSTYVPYVADEAIAVLQDTEISGTNEDNQTHMSYYEVATADSGLVGTKYRIHLRIAGKYRMVDWERCPGTFSEVPASSSTSHADYYLTSNWNGWSLQKMMEDDTSEGRFFLEVRMLRAHGQFQIVRNRSWDQVIYPPQYFAGCEDPAQVSGPDGADEGRAWQLFAAPGDMFRIELCRTVQDGWDFKEVKWQLIEHRAPGTLSAEELSEVTSTRFCAFGTWDGGARLHALAWDGSRYHFYVQLGTHGKESFQLVRNGNWDEIFFPSIGDASPSQPHRIWGPASSDGSTRGRNWTIGAGEDAIAGNVYQVSVSVANDMPVAVDWKLIPQSVKIEALEDEGFLCRQR